jgi:hypothetical protein
VVVTDRIKHRENGAVSIKLARILDSRNLELLEIVVDKSNIHSQGMSDLGTTDTISVKRIFFIFLIKQY